MAIKLPQPMPKFTNVLKILFFMMVKLFGRLTILWVNG